MDWITFGSLLPYCEIPILHDHSLPILHGLHGSWTPWTPSTHPSPKDTPAPRRSKRQLHQADAVGVAGGLHIGRLRGPGENGL